jgi:hypothetical protein
MFVYALYHINNITLASIIYLFIYSFFDWHPNFLYYAVHELKKKYQLKKDKQNQVGVD